MANAQSIRLIFIGGYAAILDQPGNRTLELKKFGQVLTLTDTDLVNRLLSIPPGAQHREVALLTEDEFKTEFPDGMVNGVMTSPGFAGKKAALSIFLRAPGQIVQSPPDEVKETMTPNG